jgi:hypothetical protein
MKSLIIFSILALPICIGAPASAIRAAQSDKVDTAVMEFTEKTQLLGVTLFGKYVFIHDAQKKAEGKPCLNVYEYKGDARTPLAERLGRQVIAFHCEMVDRPKTKIDVLTLVLGKDPGVFEIKEIQFAGTDKGHRVLSD